MTASRALLAIIAIAAVAGCRPSAKPARSPRPPEAVEATSSARAISGKAVYEMRCAACHQVSGQGVPGAFPPIAGAEVPNGPPEEHIRIVLDGQSGPTEVLGKRYSGTMPGFKRVLSAEEIAAVVSYERTAFGNKGEAVSAADVERVAGGK
ncbi:MAG: cytochrome c [Candidatus Sericytochromatia bacterium]|nr:cytochrome c [Candidatus Tanganyikabacteria bacterium]